MCIIHPLDLDGPAVFLCAQSGCPICLDALVRRHEGLVHVVLQRQGRGGVAYDDLVQEGRFAVWQAALHFDPQRGVAFSTYAGVAIERRIWRAVARADRPQGWLVLPSTADPCDVVEGRLWQVQVGEALAQVICCLPDRLRKVIVMAYGLSGEPSYTLAAIGRQWGLSRERVRQLRNDALVLLRVRIFWEGWHHLCEQDSRAAYLRVRSLNRAWLRQRRGRRG